MVLVIGFSSLCHVASSFRHVNKLMTLVFFFLKTTTKTVTYPFAPPDGIFSS